MRKMQRQLQEFHQKYPDGNIVTSLVPSGEGKSLDIARATIWEDHKVQSKYYSAHGIGKSPTSAENNAVSRALLAINIK